ncbi:uncharacterized protein EV420DRAFT_1765151 [Desarmillaria tabescens]|uniref:Uncharacterized protein n=1 Tax=Armillaria tabescens TaxID=1929756 RepID=A0AA39KBR2_ARMTA|nr:uncharacterized protein EV420DRAFT_1765151 [Desarmillaria tabescens]KAK0457050.1 hypothetical protein EV420DRAFT_1765151 [Desarmillaria tabescens]
MSSSDKFPPSDMAPTRTHSSWRFICHQILFAVKLFLVLVVGYYLLVALYVVIMTVRQSISCPNTSQTPALTTADDATWTGIPVFPDETSRDMFYRTANITAFLEEDVSGVVLLSESLEILSEKDAMPVVERAITTIENLSVDASSSQRLPGDLPHALHHLGIDMRNLFSHLATLGDTGFYATRSFARQLRHIDLALDKLWKTWSSWDYVELHILMKISCGTLKQQLALLNGELGNIHIVVEIYRNDMAEIEKNDPGRASHLEILNGGFWHAVDPLESALMIIEEAKPIPFEVCNEENFALLGMHGGVQHPSTYNGRTKERLQVYADVLEAYGNFGSVRKNNAWVMKVLEDYALSDLSRAVEKAKSFGKVALVLEAE